MSGAQRYSSGVRSNASSSAVVPRSRAASSYSARACPISFCAIDENATSSSSDGAMPVHSESRQPRISSSSAYSRSRCARSVTRLLQLRLQRIAVDAVVRLLELVVEVRHLVHGVSRDDPQRNGLLPTPVLLVREHLGKRCVRRRYRAGVRERRAFLLLAEDLEDHAASASTTCRTHASCSSMRRRRSSRFWVFGPCPVTTCFSSAQSGSLYSHTPSSRLRSFGSGTVRPSSQICGT